VAYLKACIHSPLASLTLKQPSSDEVFPNRPAHWPAIGFNQCMKFYLCFSASLVGQTACAAALCAGLASYPVQPLIGGKAFDLCKLNPPATQAVLVVNTASQCGFTPQYEGLEKLHQRFKAQGLLLVGVPANDFGAQEKGSNQDIAAFCKINYGVSFAVAQKLQTPIAQDPLFARLAASSGKAPGWNFHKYLVNRKGQVQSFDSAVEPLSPRLVSAIEAALKP
jgi:glutathione peroxidase